MPQFSKRSLDNLNTCDPRLQALAHDAIKYIDFSVVCGFRDKQAQDLAYATKRSRVPFPHSKHNTNPSKAFDLAPYPLDWKNLKRFHVLAGVLLVLARQRGLSLVWGGDWGDWDLGHFEIKD